jgi:DNA-3-methyladenine glycosylase II
LQLTKFILKPRPPFRLDFAVWTLRRRPENVIDAWDGNVYRRVVPVEDHASLIEVRQLVGGDAPRLSIQVHGDQNSLKLRSVATAAVERLLGIRLDLAPWYDFAAGKRKLGPLARRFRGMKPPRYLTGFECLANAIACQQISLSAGIQLLNRFAEAFGKPFSSGGTRRFAFPQSGDLLQVDADRMRRLGFSRQKAAALLNLAHLVSQAVFCLDDLRALSDEDAVAELCRLRGVGRWTAEYALLRGMGRLRVFPGDDVGARNNLGRWLRMSEELDYDQVARQLKRWKPFAGLIYFHLLLDKLAAAGYIRANNPHAPSKNGR